MQLSPQEFWEVAAPPVKVVIILLLIMVVACIYVAVERLIALAKGRNQSRKLAAAVSGPLSDGNADAALALARNELYKASYLAHLLKAGLKEFTDRPDKHGIEAAERALENFTITEGADLRKGMNILATTGATAPFVGLVGTIFGIINAFVGMAETGSGGLGAVSAGIAEALYTTAIGIVVAIVGVWLFNYFTARIESITNDMNVSIGEFVDWCEKQILPKAADQAEAGK